MKMPGPIARFLTALAGLAFLSVPGWMELKAATGNVERGKRIYNKLCVECHGPKGEGVPGKHRDPLHGSLSLEKLAQLIDKTMPEDAPEKCTGQDAVDAAAYIYETFYSKEARQKSDRPRVELLRLTNRQFANSIADLIKHFSGSGGTPKGEPGLKAVYFNARGPNKDKKVEERIDPRIDYNFGTSSPDTNRMGAEEFSIQWQGGIIAEETGTYEFVLRSPNGCRLWINDEIEPLMDAWVASGVPREHRASLKLLGGRVYPMRLNFFKFKDKSASISLSWKPPHGVLEIIPTRSLTTFQPTPTLCIQTPFPADDSSVGYERGTAISKAWDESVTSAAVETAQHVLKHLDRFSKSKVTDTNRFEKMESFAAAFVEHTFRKPLSVEQRKDWVGQHFKAGLTVEESVKRVILLAIKSPHFLYTGLGQNPRGLDAVAEHLSYAIWDSIPDGPLREAANSGRLGNSTGLVAQARRMIQDPRARAKMRLFLHHWLHLDRVEDVSKDTSLFPGFNASLIADLRVSLNLFLERTAWGEGSDYRKLLLSEDVFLNQNLAQFYGARIDLAPGQFQPVRLDAGERSGVLTHPYVLAAFSYAKSTSPIHRGVFLTRSVAGRALRPPPTAVAFDDASFEPGLSMREKITRLTMPASCQGCHSIINPLGFSLEHFDAAGRFRREESGRPIDARGEYETEDGKRVTFSNARDVAQFAVGSIEAQESFIEALFHHMTHQPIRAFGTNLLPSLRDGFVSTSFNIQELALQIAVRSAAVPAPAARPKLK